MIGHDEILAIAEQSGFPRISLFLPTHRTGAELRQGPIRLKNLLREAAQALEARGLDAREIDRLLTDARQHTHNETDQFWQHRDHGLAVFIGPEETRYVDAPFNFREEVKVGRRFRLKPFLPALMRDSLFYVLAASLDSVTLHRATRFGFTPLRDEQLSIAALSLGVQENVEIPHTRQRPEPAEEASAGDQAPAREMPEENDKFALQVSKVVEAILARATEPLVLAADDRLLGRLRVHCRYRGLVEEGIREHPRSLADKELHERSYALVRERLDAERATAISRLEARRNDPDAGAATRIEDVVAGAAQGRVEALVVSVDAVVPGVYLPKEGRVVVAKEETDETTDLVDYAVLQTLLNGGKVYSIPADLKDDMPPMSALFRY